MTLVTLGIAPPSADDEVCACSAGASRLAYQGAFRPPLGRRLLIAARLAQRALPSNDGDARRGSRRSSDGDARDG